MGSPFDYTAHLASLRENVGPARPLAIRQYLVAYLLLLALPLQSLAWAAPLDLAQFTLGKAPLQPFSLAPQNFPSTSSAKWTQAWREATSLGKFPPPENEMTPWGPASLKPDLQNAPLPPADQVSLIPSPPPPPKTIPGDAILTGEVSDATSLNPVAGAFVSVVGTSRTAETDAKGRFTISGLPVGSLTLEATKLGYFAGSNTITTLPNQPAEVRFGLRAKPADNSSEETTLEEETIVGEYQGDSQGDFNLNLTAESPALASGIDREEFSKTGVSDAGDAVAKVSGANIVDGKYAVVRGLADRYVTTTFNGAQIASADPARKAVQLDLFPSNVIQAINVSKTYSPELSGDFGGAAIDIISRAFPKERILNFKLKTEWNSELDDKMYVHPSGSLGFMGNNRKALPPVLETQDPITGGPQFLPTPTTSPDDLKEKMTTLHQSQDLLPKEDHAELGYSMSLTYGDTFTLPNKMKLGLMSAFGHSSGDSNNTSEINNQNRSYIKDDYERGVENSAFISTALEINDLNKIQLTYFNKTAAKDSITQGRRISGGGQNYGNIVNPAASPIVRDTYGADAVYYREFWDIGTVERDMQIIQAKGNHQVSEDGIEVDWAVTSSASAETRPHSSHFEYGLLDFSAEALAPFVELANSNLDALIKANAVGFGLNPNTATWANSRITLVGILGEGGVREIEASQGLPIVNGGLPIVKTIYPIQDLVGQNEVTYTAFRRTDKTEEDALHSQMGVKVPFYFDPVVKDRLFEIGIGGSHLKKTRKVTSRIYSLVTGISSQVNFPATLDGKGSSLAGNPSGISDDFTGNPGSPFYIYGADDGSVENVDTVLDQKSAYFSGRLQFGDFFLAGGIRQETEQYKINVASLPLVPFSEEAIRNLGWEQRETQEALLPSVTTGTSLFEKSMDVLFAWSKTVARPTFWEFLPTTSVDQSTGIVRRGNVALDRTEITNLDVSVAVRPTDDITIRASVFRKDLVRPLVQVYNADGIQYLDSISGRPFDAQITGLELESEASLGPFSIKGNFTYIDAVLNYFFEGDGKISPVTSQLPFQPSMIANATLGYEYEPWNLSAYLVYSYNGAYPTILKANEDQSEVTRLALSTFDLILAKKIETEYADCIIRCGLKNLLGAEDTYMFDGKTYSNESLGRTFYLEAEVSF